MLVAPLLREIAMAVVLAFIEAVAQMLRPAARKSSK